MPRDAEARDVEDALERLERTMRTNTEMQERAVRAQEQTLGEMKKLNENLDRFSDQAQVVLESVKGMGGLGAVASILGPLASMFNRGKGMVPRR